MNDATLPVQSLRAAETLDSRNVAGAPPTAQSAVSWPAIFAGATGTAALSLILLVLGTGLGMSSVSAWSGQGITAATLGISAIVWLTVTQVAASGMGGYLAGRLRTRWSGVHSDEVYFRDTAHGFLAWALATLVTAATLTSVVGSILGAGGDAAGTVAAGAASTAATAVPAAAAAGGASQSNVSGYFVDTLFRKQTGNQSPSSPATSNGQTSEAGGDTSQSSAEAARIIANAVSNGSLSGEDSRYLGEMVAARTGMSPADAEKRVTDTFAQMQATARKLEESAREAAEKSRKASAYAALWLFVSLLAGAFTASLMATYGGRRRDHL